jgi:hypothetical protein
VLEKQFTDAFPYIKLFQEQLDNLVMIGCCGPPHTSGAWPGEAGHLTNPSIENVQFI